MTGAPMPAGTDTAVMQEHVRQRDDTVAIRSGKSARENVRAAGEDLAKGQLALPAGKRLAPAELGLLASLGLGEVQVFRKLRVAFFSTGDELRSIGEALGEGEIYDSNRYTLYGMLKRLGAEVLDMGVVRDQREAVRRAFSDAAANADAVITSGGVSVGEADYVKETLDALGQVGFWQIAMRPGRPLAFGRVGNAAFFGLPGNPVAVMVTFYQFLQPALRHMMGESDASVPVTFHARSASRFNTRPGRTDFLRGILERDTNGELIVRSTGAQGSGILSSMSRANCFVILSPELSDVEPGTLVEVQPFDGII
jgi:molybdopterin molybdotransferase